MRGIKTVTDAIGKLRPKREPTIHEQKAAVATQEYEAIATLQKRIASYEAELPKAESAVIEATAAEQRDWEATATGGARVAGIRHTRRSVWDDRQNASARVARLNEKIEDARGQIRALESAANRKWNDHQAILAMRGDQAVRDAHHRNVKLAEANKLIATWNTFVPNAKLRFADDLTDDRKIEIADSWETMR
jgi:chromosome segregation ATPase